MKSQFATQKIKEKGLKVTENRVEILTKLMQANIPLSAHQLAAKLKNTNIVTIYRILEVFEKHGIIHFIKSEDGYIFCKIEDQNDHSFLVCQSCKNTTEFSENHHCSGEEVNAIEKNHFSCLEHYREILGKCAKCA